MHSCFVEPCMWDSLLNGPDPLPPCQDDNDCEQAVDAGCVVYTNEPLPAIGVLPKDRLNDIIRKWAASVESNTQAIRTIPTSTVLPIGNGTLTAPLQLHAKISSHADNLLKIVDYSQDNVQYQGLEVKLTPETIAILLNQILNNEALHQLFCDLITTCGSASCSIPTNMSVIPQ